jgi:ATP-dependent RNA helicase RhlE
VLAGRDLLGAAQTGTGKTAGFTLPMLQLLAEKSKASHSHARHPVRALVLVPTRELAAQVQESVRTYGRHSKLRAAVVYGGVGFKPQADELKRGVDIVVATPGRLLDHVEQKTIDLRQVEILVLDEADRMLDMGFIHDIRRVLALLPAKRQNLLFSATFPDEVRTLAAGFMHEPVTVEVARRNMPIELIGQIAHPVDKDRKRALLAHLVKSNDWQQVLVFTRTKHGANRLAEQLEQDGIEASAIHGNKSQPQRTKALKRFKDCELQVLVATDIAARGIDIEALPHVVNYDLPHVPEDYVHRIGRTGRAGESGEAVSLVSNEDQALLRDIERLINKKIEQRVIAGFEPSPGYHRASPEPQQRHGQQPRSASRRTGTSGATQRTSTRGQRATTSTGPRTGQRATSSGQRTMSSGQRGTSTGQRGTSTGQRGTSTGQRTTAGTAQRKPQRSNRAPQPAGQPARGDRGRRQEQRAMPALPSEIAQQQLLRDQREHHRRQQAEEEREKTGRAPKHEEQREKSAGASKPTKGKPLAALFALVRRKGA